MRLSAWGHVICDVDELSHMTLKHLSSASAKLNLHFELPSSSSFSYARCRVFSYTATS
jgi:hypothetical protein